MDCRKCCICLMPERIAFFWTLVDGMLNNAIDRHQVHCLCCFRSIDNGFCYDWPKKIMFLLSTTPHFNIIFYSGLWWRSPCMIFTLFPPRNWCSFWYHTNVWAKKTRHHRTKSSDGSRKCHWAGEDKSGRMWSWNCNELVALVVLCYGNQPKHIFIYLNNQKSFDFQKHKNGISF